MDFELDIYDITGLSERLDALVNCPEGLGPSGMGPIEPGPLLVRLENRVRHEIESLRFKLLGSTPVGKGECLICRRLAIPGKVQFCQLHFPRVTKMPCHACDQLSVGIKETGYSYCFSCGARSSGQKVVRRIVDHWTNLYSKPFEEVR